jgi:hypothetical protein
MEASQFVSEEEEGLSCQKGFKTTHPREVPAFALICHCVPSSLAATRGGSSAPFVLDKALYQLWVRQRSAGWWAPSLDVLSLWELVQTKHLLLSYDFGAMGGSKGVSRLLSLTPGRPYLVPSKNGPDLLFRGTGIYWGVFQLKYSLSQRGLHQGEKR